MAVHRPLIEMFWENVDKTDACWLWTGQLISDGYARLAKRNKRAIYGHRFAFEHFNGPIPEGLEIDHLCRVKRCVNPAHLEAVTHLENIKRSPNQPAGINARKTHCKRGHPLSGANLAVVDGRRVCVTCRRMRDAVSRERHREKRLAYFREYNKRRRRPSRSRPWQERQQRRART